MGHITIVLAFMLVPVSAAARLNATLTVGAFRTADGVTLGLYDYGKVGKIEPSAFILGGSTYDPFDLWVSDGRSYSVRRQATSGSSRRIRSCKWTARRIGWRMQRRKLPMARQGIVIVAWQNGPTWRKDQRVRVHFGSAGAVPALPMIGIEILGALLLAGTLRTPSVSNHVPNREKRKMRLVLILVVGGLLLSPCAAATAEAQARRWIGVAISAAGAGVIAAGARACTVSGELGGTHVERSDRTHVSLTITRTPSNVRCTSDGLLNYDISYVVDSGDFGTISEGTVPLREPGDHGPAASPIQQALTGTAEVGPNMGIVWGGVGLAAAGAVLALLPGGDQVAPSLDLRRRSFSLNRRISW